MLAHLELIFELDMPGPEFAEHNGKRHQLAHACGRHELIRLLLEQHEIGVGIHEDGVLGLGLETALRSWSLASGSREAVGANTEASAGHCELDPSAKAQGVHGTDRSARTGCVGVAPYPDVIQYRAVAHENQSS